MLSVTEALSHIDESVVLLDAIELPIVDSAGMRLADDIASDVDSPPFDKSMMDGFALRAGDTGSGSPLEVVATLFAGETTAVEVRNGQAIQIMTGA